MEHAILVPFTSLDWFMLGATCLSFAMIGAGAALLFASRGLDTLVNREISYRAARAFNRSR